MKHQMIAFFGLLLAGVLLTQQALTQQPAPAKKSSAPTPSSSPKVRVHLKLDVHMWKSIPPTPKQPDQYDSIQNGVLTHTTVIDLRSHQDTVTEPQDNVTEDEISNVRTAVLQALTPYKVAVVDDDDAEALTVTFKCADDNESFYFYSEEVSLLKAPDNLTSILEWRNIGDQYQSELACDFAFQRNLEQFRKKLQEDFATVFPAVPAKTHSSPKPAPVASKARPNGN